MPGIPSSGAVSGSQIGASVLQLSPYSLKSMASIVGNSTYDYNTFINMYPGTNIAGFPGIVSSGLVLNLDGVNSTSYIGSGTTWYDTSGNSHNASLTNTPTHSTLGSGSFSFNGTNQSAIIVAGSGTPLLSSQNSNVTMEVWFYMTGTSNNAPIFYNGNAGANGYGLYMGVCSGTYTTISVLFGGYYCSAVSYSGLSTNTWYHAVFTATSGNSNNLYINSVSVSTSTLTFAAPTSNGTAIAGNNGGQYFQGNIAVARLYNRALSELEVQQNFFAQIRRFGGTIYQNLCTYSSTYGYYTYQAQWLFNGNYYYQDSGVECSNIP
jgi:hypothetical protein